MTGRPSATGDIAGAGGRCAAPGSGGRVKRWSMRVALARLLLGVAVSAPWPPASIVVDAKTPPATGMMWAARDLDSDTWLARDRADRIDAPIAPGSIYKVVTLAAALEAGVVTSNTRITCSRAAAAALAVPPCSHADLHRPLRAEDALAHSCNVFAATVARRLTRQAFDRALRDLHLPPSDPAAPLPVEALGLGGVSASPAALLAMMARVTAEPAVVPWSAATHAVLRRGLMQAARTGTAAALASSGLDGLAKTGTVVVDGQPHGLVAGVVLVPAGAAPATTGPGGDGQPSRDTRPPRRIGFVLAVPGGTGADAAALAAARLAALGHLGAPGVLTAPASGASTPRDRASEPMPATIRVGVPRDAGGYDVRTAALEDYVAGVVAGEAAPGSSAAALEALAITVRTFAHGNRRRHRDAGFDLCTLTHCQVLGSATTATTAAAVATRAQVLVDDRGVAPVFLSASCGGRSARPSEVWPGAHDPVHLASRVDDACGGSPPWQAELRAPDIVRTLRAGGFHGDRLRGLRVVSRTPSGRAAILAVDGFVPATVPAETFRSLVGRSLGWNHLKSTTFEVTPTAAGYRFAGRGAGHGVGLCVVGSVSRAARGETAAGILSHYFPGLTVAPLPDATAVPASTVVVVMPEESRPDEDRVRRLAVRFRDELARELKVSVPPRLTLRFHPTVESYQRATGRQWFTAGATIAPAEAAFIPLTALAARGTLDETIRHELIHLLTASTYRDRSLWVHEGAAGYFSTPSADRGDLLGADRAVCPTDDELRRAPSRAALGDAYRRATVCFASAVADGRTWTQVGE